MILTDLPPEILSEITRHVQLEHDTHHVLALALSCRRVYNAVNHLIASRISVVYASQKFELLRQKLLKEEHCTYGHETRYLAFTENHGSYRESGFFQPAYRSEEGVLKRFLSSFSKLQSLHVVYTVPSLEFVDALFSDYFVARDTLRSLSIQIPNFTLAPERLFELLALPRLDRLSLSADMYDRPPDPPVLKEKSNVRHLDFASPRYVNRWQMSYLHLTYLVARCPFLTSLSINIPVPHEDALEKRLKGRTAFYLFDATRLNQALAPLASTLINLTLRTTAQQYDRHSGHFLDLSRFNVLRKLIASAWCFFTPRKQGLESRGALRNLLPQSLEYLQIEFPVEVCIFCDAHHSAGESILPEPLSSNSGWDQNLQQDKIWPSMQPLNGKDYEWLVDFARNKPQLLPNLTDMVLSEDEWYHQYFSTYLAYPFFTEELELPPLLDGAMQDAGIDCTIYVRTGRKGNYSTTPWGDITPFPPSW